MKILFNKEPAGGSGYEPEENVTLAKAEHEALVKQSEELLKIKQSDAKSQSRMKELESQITVLTGERDESQRKYSELEESIRADYYENLSEEHRKIAELIPGIEGLKQYVKLNAAKPPAGSDTGRPGSGAIDTAAKWDELTYNEKEELRKKRPELWRKLYREKFGFNN